jgi:hypothetical protein
MGRRECLQEFCGRLLLMARGKENESSLCYATVTPLMSLDEQLPGEKRITEFPIARLRMRVLPAGSTIQATVLVNEAYPRMIDTSGGRRQGLAQFSSLVARLTRQVRVGLVRRKRRPSRGCGQNRISLDEANAVDTLKRDRNCCKLWLANEFKGTQVL